MAKVTSSIPPFACCIMSLTAEFYLWRPFHVRHAA
jgi:hypothetical protein